MVLIAPGESAGRLSEICACRAAYCTVSQQSKVARLVLCGVHHAANKWQSQPMTKHTLGTVSVFVIQIKAVFRLPWGRPSRGTGWGHAANSLIRGTCRLCTRPPWHFRSGKATLACLLVVGSYFSITLQNRMCLFRCLFQVGNIAEV